MLPWVHGRLLELFLRKEFLTEARGPSERRGCLSFQRAVIEACEAGRSPGLWGLPLKVAFTFLRTLLEARFLELK